MSDYLGYGEEAARQAAGFWGRIHPSLRAALVLCALHLALAIVGTVTGGTAIVICLPVQALLFVANGALAGLFAIGSDYDAADLPKIGALAGLLAWVLPALYYLIFAIILGIVALPVGLFGLIAGVICGPIALAIQAGLGAFGAWLYGRITGAASTRDDDPYSCL